MTDIAHILVVDDHRDIREPLAKYLTQTGFRVSEADSAVNAKQLMATNAIDLVVLDASSGAPAGSAIPCTEG